MVSFKRIAPIILVTILIYAIYSIQSVNRNNIGVLTSYFVNFDIKYPFVLLTNFSHFFFPESLENFLNTPSQNELFTPSIMGIFMLIFIFWFLRYALKVKQEKKFAVLIFFLMLSSYLNYHLFTPLVIHYPTQNTHTLWLSN